MCEATGSVLDTKREEAVFDAIDSRVNQGKPFTAYRITQMVRSRYPGADVPHESVKFLVHGLYDVSGIPGYIREVAEDIAGSPFRYRAGTVPDVRDFLDSDSGEEDEEPEEEDTDIE